MVLQTDEYAKIVIVGAGGDGRDVLWTIQDCNKAIMKYEIVGFVDENKSLWGKNVNNVPVLGGLEWFSNKNSHGIQCVVAIGDPKIREKITKELEKRNVKFAKIIHPSVIYSEFVEIGEGTIIRAGSILTVNIKVGNHVHINIDCTIGHDSVIEDFATISPGVHINGHTVIEQGAFIGTGAVMKDEIRIGKGSIVGAGTVVISDVPELSMWVGVPGKLKKKLSQ